MSHIDDQDTYGESLVYSPKLLYNNHKEGKKVLHDIEKELNSCQEFYISVAFIKDSGLAPLKMTLKELEEKGIPGKILTTDYLTFSEPKALDEISKFKNIEIKMYRTDEANLGFHTKGYVFKKGDIYKIIVGSSNLTHDALLKNHEWNTKITSIDEAIYVNNVLEQFNQLWHSPNTYNYCDIKETYEKEYELKKQQKSRTLDFSGTENNPSKLIPNSMQQKFIENLRLIVDSGENKALLISATGTGKTYASAFAARELGFKKILFLAHRKEILNQAKNTYEKVFDHQLSTGLLTGNNKSFDSDILFATVQTITQSPIINQFSENQWDLIIIDEAHHSTAASYKKILEYFNPKLWLGMTATPDKRIKEESVYDLFNHNIAHEIRLQDALEEDLLCPFHYYGITDLDVDNQKIDSKSDFKYLTSDNRVKHIMTQAGIYGYSGDRVKGLIFCSNVNEAIELSNKLNKKGLRTQALSGNDSSEKRQDAINRLVQKDGTDNSALDYILTVDIFSEGVDVPEINQIIMLRPTQSPIVFTQQLGRGLRKSIDKEYVVILDFIGNYDSNYMIPIALSGDKSYNKDTVRRFVYDGGATLPGTSTIHFDKIAREKIYTSIDQVKFSSKNLIKENYQNLKYKLGHIPKLSDFELYGEMDVQLIINEYNSYHEFLLSVEKQEYNIKLNEIQTRMIEFVSKKIANGKRIHELVLLQLLLHNKNDVLSELKRTLKSNYDIVMDYNCEQNIINYMTNNFLNNKKYNNCIFIKQVGDRYEISTDFKKQLQDDNFRSIISELITYGINCYEKKYSNRYLDTDLVINQKYTYEDVIRLLNWEKDVPKLNIGGYMYNETTKTMPVFVNYHKHEDGSNVIKYEDRFIDQQQIITISKRNRTLNSDDVNKLTNSLSLGIDLHLFVRKNKNDKEGNEFYYLGKMSNNGFSEEIIMDDKAENSTKAVEMGFDLDVPVQDNLYNYIVEE